MNIEQTNVGLSAGTKSRVIVGAVTAIGSGYDLAGFNGSRRYKCRQSRHGKSHGNDVFESEHDNSSVGWFKLE